MKAHELVYNQIEQRIIDQTYRPDHYLPSEYQFSKEFSVSRDTIRRALNTLMENGYIQKIHGKGSIVLKREQLRFPIAGLTSFRELQSAQGYESDTQVISLTEQIINEQSSVITGFPINTTVWVLLRSRAIEGRRVILDYDYLDQSFVKTLDIASIKYSLYDYLENVLHLAIAYAEKEITVDALTYDDRTYLELDAHDRNIVSVKSRVFLQDAMQFQYTESRHQVDQFRFTDFARRRLSTF